MKVVLIVLAALVAVLAVAILIGRGFHRGTPADSAWVRQSAAWEKQVAVDGVKLRVLDVGSGTPILLLHGWADSTFTWREVIARLKDHRRLIAVDWPGFGWSEKPDRIFGYRDLAAFSVAVLDALGIEKAFVAGNSMGGGAALKMAADYPARVLGVIPVDAHTELVLEKPDPMLNLLIMNNVGEVASWAMGRSIYRIMLTRLVVDKDLVTADVVRETYLPVTSPGGRRASLRAMREISARPVTFQDISKIKAPMLILWGARDVLTSKRAGKKLHEMMPGSKLAIFDNAGHTPQWERPDEVAKLMDGFVADVTSRP
jgi:pimeloyl-ACP methyl ester carboxylesterase